MTRRTHAYATTTVTLQSDARLILRCAQDPPGEEADLTDTLAFLVHTGKHAPAHEEGASAEAEARLVDFGELRLDRHGHVVLDGHRVRARQVLQLAATGLEVVVADLAREWRERAAALEESLDDSDAVGSPSAA